MRGNSCVTGLPSPNSSNRAPQDGFHSLEDIFLLDEAHFDVELVKFARRTVGASVFVAETGCDLEIAIETRDHHELLELLWLLAVSA